MPSVRKTGELYCAPLQKLAATNLFNSSARFGGIGIVQIKNDRSLILQIEGNVIRLVDQMDRNFIKRMLTLIRKHIRI